MTNFNYNRDIPDGPHNPSVDQPMMKVNTNSTMDLIAVDHVSFSSNEGGTHNKSTYNRLLADPTTALNQIALYTKQESGNGTALFMVRDNIGATVTNLTTSKIAAPIATTSGVSWLPGGILIQWGTAVAVSSATPIAFNVTFPNALFNVLITQINTTLTVAQRVVSVLSQSTSGFLPRVTTLGSPPSDFGPATISWMAIGN